MTGIWVFLGVVGIVFLGWMISEFLSGPADREFDRYEREHLEEQARKRNGNVNVTWGRAALLVPYKAVSIEISTIGGGSDDSSSEHTYARFRIKVFADKEFRIILNSKDFMLKPRFVGSKLEVSDERLGEKYFVAGNDAPFVSRVLTQEIRDKLLEASLFVQFGKRVGTIIGERGWLTIYEMGMAIDYDRIIETAILFYERLEILNSDTRGSLTTIYTRPPGSVPLKMLPWGAFGGFHEV